MNANLEYEIKARAFHRMTGYMAPGKDEAAASHGDSYEVRVAIWAQWHQQWAPCIDALLWAVAKELDNE